MCSIHIMSLIPLDFLFEFSFYLVGTFSKNDILKALGFLRVFFGWLI